MPARIPVFIGFSSVMGRRIKYFRLDTLVEFTSTQQIRILTTNAHETLERNHKNFMSDHVQHEDEIFPFT